MVVAPAFSLLLVLLVGVFVAVLVLIILAVVLGVAARPRRNGDFENNPLSGAQHHASPDTGHATPQTNALLLFEMQNAAAHSAATQSAPAHSAPAATSDAPPVPQHHTPVDSSIHHAPATMPHVAPTTMPSDGSFGGGHHHH